ncbi:MAG: protease inhibitor Kazal-type [Bacteroidota bacterium]
MKSVKMLIFGATMALLSLSACEPHQCFEYSFPHCDNCIDLYEPVCGCNDKTYRNACEAECKGIQTYSYGQCSEINTR